VERVLVVVEGARRVRQGQLQLESQLRAAISQSVETWVGYKGGKEDVRAHWSDQLGIWFATRPFPDADVPRFWNAFGLAYPGPGASITCEINLPFDGVSPLVQGALVEDVDGRVFLVHRGKIGGGRPGIGRERFLDHYRGQMISFHERGKTTSAILIGALGDPELSAKVADFVREVDRIKRLILRK
jgi:hypothetical protein